VVVIDRIKIDDPVGAIAVHGVNGFFGTIAVGLFASESGLFFGGGFSQLVTQLTGVVAIGAMSFISTYVIFKILDKTIGVRVSKEEEYAGIDAATFGVEAYSTFE
jgi:Amt family ammonium transporter